jgi:hypothetical protein
VQKQENGLSITGVKFSVPPSRTKQLQCYDPSSGSYRPTGAAAEAWAPDALTLLLNLSDARDFLSAAVPEGVTCLN